MSFLKLNSKYAISDRTDDEVITLYRNDGWTNESMLKEGIVTSHDALITIDGVKYYPDSIEWSDNDSEFSIVFNDMGADEGCQLLEVHNSSKIVDVKHEASNTTLEVRGLIYNYDVILSGKSKCTFQFKVVHPTHADITTDGCWKEGITSDPFDIYKLTMFGNSSHSMRVPNHMLDSFIKERIEPNLDKSVSKPTQTVRFDDIKDVLDAQSIVNDLIDKGFTVRVRQLRGGMWKITGHKK